MACHPLSHAGTQLFILQEVQSSVHQKTVNQTHLSCCSLLKQNHLTLGCFKLNIGRWVDVMLLLFQKSLELSSFQI